jgi:hypothetical protein
VEEDLSQPSFYARYESGDRRQLKELCANFVRDGMDERRKRELEAAIRADGFELDEQEVTEAIDFAQDVFEARQSFRDSVAAEYQQHPSCFSAPLWLAHMWGEHCPKCCHTKRCGQRDGGQGILLSPLLSSPASSGLRKSGHERLRRSRQRRARRSVATALDDAESAGDLLPMVASTRAAQSRCWICRELQRWPLASTIPIACFTD